MHDVLPTLCCIPSFFFIHTPTTEIYTLSLHDALPISTSSLGAGSHVLRAAYKGDVNHAPSVSRSEEHTSELQSRVDLVCRLLLEKKKNDLQTRCFRP